MSHPTPLSAFAGDDSLKQAVLEKAVARWNAREVFPLPKLTWQPEKGLRSLAASLVESEEADAFSSKLGLPCSLALLCESLLGAGCIVTFDRSVTPTKPSVTAPLQIASFAGEWLAAIRPGADLSQVPQRFVLAFLNKVIAAEQGMGTHMGEPGRQAVQAVATLLSKSLAQQSSDAKQWSTARKAALLQVDEAPDVWGQTALTFAADIAWPPEDMADELVGLFRAFSFIWLEYLQLPFMSEELLEDTEAMLGGLRVVSDGSDVEAARAKHPNFERAIQAFQSEAGQAAMKACRDTADLAVSAAVREAMELMLACIRSA
ncbi:MAG: hypothetical protein IPP87_22415 [Ideonella sp.]|nr:hypothetical protein [Ideonella sp.]MBL0151259.1 hypothetical protein [Ideonella sp.]